VTDNDNAVIFDIKEFAVHDGPGVRTTVFFKGCPLRCVWCHNPEGLSPEKQLMTKTSRCRQCGRCRTECTHEACQPFGRCVYACPDALISVCGRDITADALYSRLMRDADFLRTGGGGITFSGGEPLMQHAFLRTMLKRFRESGVHTAVETSGFASAEIFRAVVSLTDYVIMDLKLADPALHKKYTGADNTCILANAAWLKSSGIRHEFRTPLIPGITDTEENIRALRAVSGGSPHEFLPYNTLAGAKYPMLAMEYPYDVIASQLQTEKE